MSKRASQLRLFHIPCGRIRQGLDYRSSMRTYKTIVSYRRLSALLVP